MRRFNFKLGAKVHCEDGECGHLANLVVDPTNDQVVGLIVEKGMIFTQNRVIPIALVQYALGDEIKLLLSRNAVDEYPTYRVIEVEEPVPHLEQNGVQVVTPFGVQNTPFEPTVPMVKHTIHTGIEETHLVLEKGMPINNLEGGVGQLEHVLVERGSNLITHLVAKRGLIFGEKLLIPWSMVAQLGEHEVFIDGLNDTVDGLERFTDEIGQEFLVGR